MTNIEQTKKLLAWNTQNLIANADLKKAEIADLFASSFRVVANGREYDANYDNYYDFLNQFRATIKSITYHDYRFLEACDSITIPLTAHIIRTNDEVEKFNAILILEFNQEHKITLWHEVYIKM